MIMPSLQNILSTPNGDLNKILQAINQIKSLNDFVQKALPDNLKKHVWVVNLNQGKLILEAENSSWAAKLRYALPELLSSLRKFPELAGLKSIEPRIAVKQYKSLESKKIEPSDFQLSQELVQTLKSCIEKSSDNRLKQALKQFLQHYA